MGLGRPEIDLLGRFAVRVDGAEVSLAAFGGRKVRQLIRVLAVRRGLHTTHDALTDALWPQQQPADPAANLGVLVNRARKVLGTPGVITTAPAGYALTGDCAIDAELFAVAVEAARGRTGSAAEKLSAYVVALRHWAGEPLPEDVDAPWAAAYRLRLMQLHYSALEEAAALALDAGEPTLAVSLAEAAVAAEPLREAAHVLLAQALALANDTAGALAALRGLRRALSEELGLEPSAAAKALQQQLLTDRPIAVPTRPAHDLSLDLAARLPFVGRTDQLAAVLAATAPVPAGGTAGLVVVAGAAGAGKSRLLAELATRSPLPLLAARAFLPEQAEPWSLARSMLRAALELAPTLVDAVPPRTVAALADVVPELSDATGAAATLDPQSRRALIGEGALRLLSAAAARGVVLAVDDLQWTDPGSLTLLASLLERQPGLPCVLAHRPEELPADGGLSGFLADLTVRRPVRTVTLPPLSAADLAGFLDASVAEQIGRATDGTPFAVTEVIRALLARRELAAEQPGRWRGATPATTALVAELGRAGRARTLLARVQRYPATERDVLGVLALAARELPPGILGAALALPASTVLAALANLSGGGLTRLGARGWATSHDLIRETIVEGLARAQRGRLHGMLAIALEGAGADPAELATHLAGAGEAEAAAQCYVRAGTALMESADCRQAVELVDNGLQLSDHPETRRQLLSIRAQARAHTGDLTGARHDLQTALTGCEPGPQRAVLLAKLAMLYSGAEDPQRASELAEIAIVEAGEDRAAQARALEVAAILDMNLDRAERSRARSEAALDLYTRGADAHGAARIMDGRAMAAFLDGAIGAAITVFGRVADLFTDSGDLHRVITPESTCGHALVFHAEPAAGLRRTEAALDLARALGHREGQTYALWHRSEALVALGRADDAVASARDGLAIAEALGHRGWTATSLRALGIALAAQADLDGANAAFTRSLHLSDGLSLFASWAASRLASTLVAQGHVDKAAPLAARALAAGPPLSGYEARLAYAQVAAARGEAGLAALVDEAIRRAEGGGALATVPALRALLPA